MKVITLPDPLHEYLVHVVEKHAASGIHPEEGTAVHKLWEAVTKGAQHLDDSAVQQMAQQTLGKTAPGPWNPENPGAYECEACFNEEGSYRCVRPAHRNQQAKRAALPGEPGFAEP